MALAVNNGGFTSILDKNSKKKEWNKHFKTNKMIFENNFLNDNLTKAIR